MKITSNVDNVEVSGIYKVVFYGATQWVRVNANRGDILWAKVGKKSNTMTQDKMMSIIKRKFSDPRYRVIYSGDTCNIKRVEDDL